MMKKLAVAASAAVWTLAGAGALRALRRRRRLPWTYLLLMLAPLSLAAVQSYGGEILLRVYLFSAQREDAAELIARLGPRGQFQGGYSNLSELSGAVAEMKETHLFYPVLFFFRFPVPYHSVSSIGTVSLDAVSLILSALNEREYVRLQESGAGGGAVGGVQARHHLPGCNLPVGGRCTQEERDEVSLEGSLSRPWASGPDQGLGPGVHVSGVDHGHRL